MTIFETYFVTIESIIKVVKTVLCGAFFSKKIII